MRCRSSCSLWKPLACSLHPPQIPSTCWQLLSSRLHRASESPAMSLAFCGGTPTQNPRQNDIRRRELCSALAARVRLGCQYRFFEVSPLRDQLCLCPAAVLPMEQEETCNQSARPTLAVQRGNREQPSTQAQTGSAGTKDEEQRLGCPRHAPSWSMLLLQQWHVDRPLLLITRGRLGAFATGRLVRVFKRGRPVQRFCKGPRPGSRQLARRDKGREGRAKDQNLPEYLNRAQHRNLPTQWPRIRQRALLCRNWQAG